MANETILISEVIPTTPERIFSAWLDSAEHSSFTGSQAAVLPFVGGEYSAWDGYVQGRTLELNDGARIVQSWRTNEFPADSPDSRLEITLEATSGGTLLTLLHTDIPSGQSDRVREGWHEYYLSRMKSYFGEDSTTPDAGDFASAVDGLGMADDAAPSADGVSPLLGFDVADALVWEDAIPSHVEPVKPVPAAAKKPTANEPTLAAVAKKPAAPVVKTAARKPAKKLKAAARKPVKNVTKVAARRPAKKAKVKKAARRAVGKRPKAGVKANKKMSAKRRSTSTSKASKSKPKPASRKRR